MKLFLIPTFLVFYLSLSAQEKLEPRIAVLYPARVTASDEIKADLKGYEKHIEITDEIRSNYIKEGLAENWKIIRTHELNYLSSQDFYGLIAFNLSTNLIYKLYNFYDFPIVFPVKEESAENGESLKKIALKYDVDWVVDIVTVEFSEDREKSLKTRILLYNIISNRIFYSLDYTGESNNPGGNLECEEGSWECASNNIIIAALEDIFDRIEKNRKYWR